MSRRRMWVQRVQAASYARQVSGERARYMSPHTRVRVVAVVCPGKLRRFPGGVMNRQIGKR